MPTNADLLHSLVQFPVPCNVMEVVAPVLAEGPAKEICHKEKLPSDSDVGSLKFS